MRQAYLICAHGSFNLLKRLIRQLDYPDNDIFIHLDKKCGEIDYYQFEAITRYSKVCCLRDRISVGWGDVTLIKATLMLLIAAKSYSKYDYYHLISGVDFPIKSSEYIKRFLEKHNGKEFVGFKPWDATLDYKLGLYHLIPKNVQDKYGMLRFLNKCLLKTQKILNIRHYKNTHNFYKGSEWWSITDKLVSLLIENKDTILRKYRYTSCSDEIFVQTIIGEHPEIMSKVYDVDNEYKSCLRCIDWDRGNPYIWQSEDINMLMTSDTLFARKFSESKMEVIDEIIARLNNR